MNWIQNDNQNVDGVDQHPKAWQSLLPLHWSTFYSITLHSFDAVLCHMIVLHYMWKHLGHIQVAQRFATVSGLNDMFPGNGVQRCLRYVFSCLVGVSEMSAQSAAKCI